MREVVSFLHSYYTIQVFANCLHVAGQCVPISSRQRRKFIRLFQWKHFVQLKVVLEIQGSLCEEEKGTPCSFLLSRYSQLGILIRDSNGTNFLLRAKRLSVCLPALFLFELKIKAISWLSLSETCTSPVCESKAVCGSAYVCVCDSFTMCRVAAWGWMKSDVKEPVRSGLPSETLLLLLPPPLPLPPDWRLDRKTLLCMLPGTLSL